MSGANITVECGVAAPEPGLTAFPLPTDRFFAKGPVTVFSASPSPWRWLVATGRQMVEATVIEGDSPTAQAENKLAQVLLELISEPDDETSAAAHG